VRDTIALRCEPLSTRVERRQRVEAAQQIAEAADEIVEERVRRRERAERVQPERDKGRVDAARQRQQALFEERAHTAAFNRRLAASHARDGEAQLAPFGLRDARQRGRRGPLQ
jgi:hypothetical protein